MGWWPGSRRRTPAPASTAPATTAPERTLDGPAVPEVRVDRSPESRLSAATARVATWSLRLLLIVAGLTVLGYVIGKLWVIVLPTFLGLVLASVLWPLTRLFRRGMPDSVASLLTILVTLMALGALGAVLVPMVSGQFDELVDAVVAGLEDLKDLVAQPPFNLGEEEISNLFDNALSQLQEHTQTIGGGLLTGVTAVGGVLLNTVLAVVLTFFFLKDGPKFLPWISGWVGSRAAPHVAELARRSWDTLSGFIRAQALVGLVDAVGIGIGLVVLGVPLALPLAVLVFFGAFIPIVGAFVAGALAALVALVFNGVASALMVVALILIVQQIEGNVLQPLLMGRTLQLHAALVILAVAVGSALAGIAGAFLAVPVFAVATTMVRYARDQVMGEGTVPAVAGPADPHRAGA